MVYKNPNAFYSKSDEVCYIPENDDTKYTYNDFLELAKNEEVVAKAIFNIVSWQSPSTALEEMYSDEEVNECIECNRLYLSYNIDYCPHCNKRKVLNLVNQESTMNYYYSIDETEYCITLEIDYLDEMEWSWESLIFADNDKIFAIVENKETKELSVLTSSGDVIVKDAVSGTKLEIEKIIDLSKKGEINDESKYIIQNNNWFALQHCDEEHIIIDDEVFEAKPQNPNELSDILLDLHLSFFNN